MKAVVWTKYGAPDGLKLEEVDKPTPKADEILVKIHAASVTAGDCEMRRLKLPLGLSFPMRIYAGFFKPKRIQVLGQELAGEVVEVGNQVTNFQPGDFVFGTTGFKFGANAEYICLPANPDSAQGVLAPKPASVTFEEAATIPTGGFEALYFMRESNIQPGMKVLIIGAGGSIGTFSLQLAKYFGAEVTGVDSTEKQALLLSLGVDHAVDFTHEDYTKTGETYDLIIDVVGKHSIRRRLKLLKPDGVYHLAFARFHHLFLARWTAITSQKRLSIQSANQTKEGLESLSSILEKGGFVSIVDKTFPLEKVADAHRYHESGKKKGNIAIAVAAE